MRVTVDKAGSLNLSAELCKSLGLEAGSHLDLIAVEGGGILLHPIPNRSTIRLNDKGLAKLQEARSSGLAELPEWIVSDMQDAGSDTD